MTAAIAATDRRRLVLRRLAQVCLVLLVLVVVLSAFMRHRGTGLGCENWPACYGQDLRDAQAGKAVPVYDDVALARRAHRLVATGVLVLVIAMVLGSIAMRPVLRREGVLAAGLFILVLGLAALGVATPGSRVPAVTLGNLLGGFAMVALCARLARVAGEAPGRPRDVVLARSAGFAGILLVGQIALGALVSAAHAGLDCRAIAECLEQAGGAWNLAAFDPWRVSEPGAGDPSAGAAIQLAHRVGAVLAAVAVLVLGLLAWDRDERRSALALAGLLLAVLALGIVIGDGSLPLPAVLLHNLAAAGLLATVLRLP